MLVLTASLGCTLCVHLLVPSCSRFAGISGINYALIAFLLGRFLLQRPIITISCATLLCLYQLVLVNGEGRPVPVWQVHLGASFIGFIFWYITDGIRTVTAQSEPILLNPTGKDTQPCV